MRVRIRVRARVRVRVRGRVGVRAWVRVTGAQPRDAPLQCGSQLWREAGGRAEDHVRLFSG